MQPTIELLAKTKISRTLIVIRNLSEIYKTIEPPASTGDELRYRTMKHLSSQRPSSKFTDMPFPLTQHPTDFTLLLHDGLSTKA